jgi:hypothetical protein
VSGVLFLRRCLYIVNTSDLPVHWHVIARVSRGASLRDGFVYTKRCSARELLLGVERGARQEIQTLASCEKNDRRLELQ